MKILIIASLIITVAYSKLFISGCQIVNTDEIDMFNFNKLNGYITHAGLSTARHLQE